MTFNIDLRYTNGKIYKLISNVTGDVYYGSTIKSLKHRLSKHKSLYKIYLQGKYNYVVGLANDEVGYIMPRTHWDTEAPYSYGSQKPFYGEINSLGPEAGPTLHKEVKKLIER